MINVIQTLRRGSRGDAVKQVQRALHLYEDGIFGPLTEEAVKELQRHAGIKADGIVGPATWALISGESLKKSSRRITEIIVHCSATPEGRDFTVADITRWHKERGFSTIGYHYVVYRDGSVREGRNINIAGAHCTGHNSNSIGICYIGGTDANGKAKDTRTIAQVSALRTLINKLRALYPGAKVYGHRDFARKDCPCFDARKEYGS